jgi:hypothetical protein
MNQSLTKVLLLCVLLAAESGKGRACSVFNASRIDKVFAATNKDWNNPETRILFIPDSPGKYGRVYFGYQVEEGFQNVGGMNDQGLWYDGASLPARSDIRNYYNKPVIQGELCEKALEECATVEEVIELYKTYFTPHWQGHSMWADRFGNSVILEFGEKDVVFIRKEHEIQAMTNYYVSDPNGSRWYNCHRYRAITEILEQAGHLSIELMTRALDASHSEGLTPTLFSNVYDLRNGKICLYHFHNYAEVVHLDLAHELSKGDQYIRIPDLFHGIELNYPADGQLLGHAEAELKWSGGAGRYEIYCTENESSINEQPVCVVDLPPKRSSVPGLSFFASLLLAGGCLAPFKKGMKLILISCLLILGGCSSCSKLFISPHYPDLLQGSAVVRDLKPGTTYYWKVVAVGDQGINSQSMVQSFRTGGSL